MLCMSWHHVSGSVVPTGTASGEGNVFHVNGEALNTSSKFSFYPSLKPWNPGSGGRAQLTDQTLRVPAGPRGCSHSTLALPLSGAALEGLPFGQFGTAAPALFAVSSVPRDFHHDSERVPPAPTRSPSPVWLTLGSSGGGELALPFGTDALFPEIKVLLGL